MFAPASRPHFLSDAVLVLTLVMAAVLTYAPPVNAMHSAGAREADIADDAPGPYSWLGGVVLVVLVVLLALALLRKALRIIVAFAAVLLVVAACVGVAYWVLSPSPAPFALPW